MRALDDVRGLVPMTALDVVDSVISSLVCEVRSIRAAALVMLNTECAHGRSCSDVTHQRLWAVLA